MLKLSRAIAGWMPSDEGARRDPLALLQAGWGEIVGAEVAANSAPARILDDTLTIVTRSSAWGHQLSFLGDHIRDAVAARLPSAGIERLRFRVGALPRRSSARPPQRAGARTIASTSLPPSANAGEALARFAQRVETSRRAKTSAGWKECGRCAALIAPSPQAFCGACAAVGREERAGAAARLLFEAPWLGFAGTAALVNGLYEEEYERVRRALLKRWWGLLEQAKVAGRLSPDGRERLVASSYVVLRSKLPPEEIMPATVRSVLGDELHDLLYGGERRT